MKQITFLAILIVYTTISYSQSNEFIGVLGGGGPLGTGVIYKTDSIGRFKGLVHTFEKVDGRRPVGELALAKDGSFYGIASNGGKYGRGVLFQYFPTSKKYKALFQFGANSFAGTYPMAGVKLASNGKLYGSTQQGGAKGQGSLFCYDISRDSLTLFHSFENANNSGYNPQAPFTETKDGHLLIVTYYGGIYGNGAIYQIDTSSLATTRVADFYNPQTGRNPFSALVEVSPNIFYGVTQLGGSKDEGVLFKFNLNTKTLTNKKNFFDKTTGEYPYGSLMLAGNGKLYGTTNGSSLYTAIIFEYNPADSIFKKLYEFTSEKGESPRSVLVEGKDGILYGTTSYGGNSNQDGTLYSYKIGSDTITKLWTFEEAKYGNRPRSGVTFGKDGKLYGIVNEGKGVAYDGTLYSYDITTNTFDRPIFFNSSTSGLQPSGNLVQAANEMLYGIAQIGGENNRGLVFSIHPTTNEYKAEASFTDSTGFATDRGFIEASNGKLYGVCSYGVNTAGNIIEFDPITRSLKNVANFEATVTGTGLEYGLMEADNGELFGVRSSGGAYDNGTLFRYNLNTQTLSKLVDFKQTTTGRNPEGRPVLVNGKLYGLTYTGGANDEGVLYEFNPSNSQLFVKLSFSRNVSGKRPIGSLLLASNGLLYGTTTEGGDYSVGSLFEYNITTNTLLIKASFFRGLTEEKATGELMQGSNSYIYGLTSEGGDYDAGVMFEYKIGTKLITRKYHLKDEIHGNYANSAPLELNQCKFTKTIITAPEVSARAIMVSYQWLNCDNNYQVIPGETKQNFRPKIDGNYAVEITSRFCKDTSDCINLTPSGVNDISEKYFSIYPNPSSGLVNISLKQSNFPIEIQVYNSLGMLIHEETLFKTNNALSKRFETGVYSIVLRQNKDQFVKKVIVMN